MVGFLKKVSAKLGSSEESEVDEYLDTLGLEHEDILAEEADVWVKPYVLQDTSEDKAIIADVESGNVVILNIEPLYKRNSIKLKQAINEIKTAVQGIDGDMARLTEYKIIVCPKGMKVAKTRK